jgi:hypothetical protein
MGDARRPGGKWRARVLGPDGRERSKQFATRALALRWEREQLTARDRGQFVAPRDGELGKAITFESLETGPFCRGCSEAGSIDGR